MTEQPYCIKLQKTEVKSATLSFMEELGDLPIDIKRLYWIYDVEEGAERGNHAHVNADRVMVCMAGLAKVVIESAAGEKFDFTLDDPSKVLFFPRAHWINLTLAKNSILLVASSCAFKDDVLITDYQEFKKASLQKHMLS